MSHSESISIQFMGAAQTVTGSKFLVTARGKRILVDCGLFQGLKDLRLRNWDPLPVDPASIDVVVLTHGHLDHCGYLPLLVKNGFYGSILATQPTIQIAEIVLRDSAKIQVDAAKRANKYEYSKHKQAAPLYRPIDVEATKPLFLPVPKETWHSIAKDIQVRFQYNGHILGATYIELRIGEKIIVFSGDIGRPSDPLLYAPTKPTRADLLITEATYGNRHHPEAKPIDLLCDEINQAKANHGTIVIPSFSVERAQLLMFLLWQLQEANRIPDIPIYMDSPMAKSVLKLFQQNSDWHKLSAQESHAMCSEIKVIDSSDETFALMKKDTARIVIAGGGMGTGGKVLSYFAKYIGDPKATILLSGFQAAGTRGRALLEGDSEIKMYGKYFKVRAQISKIDGLSGHADQGEMLDWMSDIATPPEQVLIVHSEPHPADAMRIKIQDTYGWPVTIPTLNETFEWTVTDHA